jgi:RimJ/RimL family protein N-acetyltransferase
MTHTLPEPREATPDDKENILRVIGSYPQAKWDRPIAKKYFDDFFKYGKVFEYDKVYVIEDHHDIVGVIGYHTDKYETKNVWLGWFYVHSDYQKRGYTNEDGDVGAKRNKKRHKT